MSFLCLIKLPAVKLYGGWRCGSMCTYPQHWMKVSGQLHALDCSFLGKSPWHPIGSRLGGPRSGLGTKERRKGRAIAEAVSRWLPTVAARVRARV
jgi:hypothetical protein